MVGLLALSSPSAFGAETPEGARADDVALISGQANGSKSTNLFAGFTSPATTVSTVSGSKYLTRTDGTDKLILTSTYDCRDSEVTTWFSKGIVFLRHTGTRAIWFSLNVSAAHDLRVGIATGLDESALVEGTGTYYTNQVLDLSTVSGWSASYTSGDLYTFGCVGFDIYVKYKGTEILRFKEWRHVAAGHFAVWQQPGNGLIDTTVKYLPYTMTGSNRALQYFDIRDFGAKSTTTTTTGSISASSSSLTVASATGFAVNDYIVVEIGGEAGLGARGTAGVGGTWPTLSYANTTLMNADSSKSERTYCWVPSSGLVYIYASGAWIHHSDGSGAYNQAYYTEKALPKALRAKITGIAGNVITLNTAATTTTTNANVYVDCANSFNVLTDTLSDNLVATSNVTLAIPSGSFALGAALSGTARPGITISGRGKGVSTLFSPKGTICVSINIDTSTGATYRDFTMVGNHGTGSTPDGYQLVYNTGASDYYSAWPTTCGMSSCTNGSWHNVAVRDVLSYAFNQGSCTDTWAYNCDLTMSASLKQYTQWFFESANSVRGGFVDCYATGPSLMKCFETFNGDRVQFIRCGGQNALASTNSSGGYVFDGFYSTITANSYDNTGAGYYGEAVLNVNANAFPTDGLLSQGGTITNPRIIQSGYVDASNNTLIGIQISSVCINVTITGQYPEGGTHTTTKGGYFQAPNYNGTSSQYGGMAVYSDGAGTSITGIRVVGSAIGSPGLSSHYGNISVAGSGSSVTTCVADVIQGGTQSGNQTNSGY